MVEFVRLKGFRPGICRARLFITIERVDLAVKVGVCVGNEFNGMVPRPWLREFVEILFLE